MKKRDLALIYPIAAALLGLTATSSWATEKICTPAIAWTDVPAQIRERLVQAAGENISPQGGPFNPTDVLDGRPRLRFFGACRMADQWTIALERGGRAHHLQVFKFSGNALADKWSTFMPKGGFTPDALTQPEDGRGAPAR